MFHRRILDSFLLICISQIIVTMIRNFQGLYIKVNSNIHTQLINKYTYAILPSLIFLYAMLYQYYWNTISAAIMDAVWDFKDSVRNPNLPNMAKWRIMM